MSSLSIWLERAAAVLTEVVALPPSSLMRGRMFSSGLASSGERAPSSVTSRALKTSELLSHSSPSPPILSRSAAAAGVLYPIARQANASAARVIAVPFLL